MKKYLWNIVFLIALILVAYFYSYHEIAFKRPQSVHEWRQCDCASIALNYYQGGMNFFHPETHNLTSDGGTTGYACTSEIPILYYGVALLYKLFGYNEAVFRILNTLLFFLGLFYLFRLLKLLLNDGFWALSVSILFFSSPVLVFYGNNFLSNSSALAFSIVGWYYFLLFYFRGRSKWFGVAILAFFIAGSFKVTALFSLFAIGGIFISERLAPVRFKQGNKLFTQATRPFLFMFGAVALIAAWLIYARYYNQKHDCTYFSTTIFPIWMLDSEGIKSVLEKIKTIWLYQYFHPSVLLFLGVGFAGVIVRYKRNLKVLNFALGFILVEIVVYVLLQFWTFKDHDYYTIDIYILPMLSTAAFLYVLKSGFPKLFFSSVLKVLFTIFVLFNVHYANKTNTDRYQGWMNNNGRLEDAHTITAYLREVGIKAEDKVISIPDGSHVSLYLMNQKGWTEYSDARLNREEPVLYNRDSVGIEKSIANGAKYLIMNGIGQLYQKPYLQAFCTHLSGRYNNTLVFDLDGETTNFNLQNRQVKARFFSDSEALSPNGTEYISSVDSAIFRNGDTQSPDHARSGSFGCKLIKERPYGYTITLTDLKYGESIHVSVWRKQSSGGTLVASSTDYYNNSVEIIETVRGWEKLSKSFFISKELEGRELVFYAYNPSEEPVYFDDFELIHYKSVVAETH